jgi:hypothetical protein
VIFITLTTSIIGISINKPTTVTSVAPDSKPKMAIATASLKKFDASVSVNGQAIEYCSPTVRFIYKNPL